MKLHQNPVKMISLRRHAFCQSKQSQHTSTLCVVAHAMQMADEATKPLTVTFRSEDVRRHRAEPGKKAPPSLQDNCLAMVVGKGA